MKRAFLPVIFFFAVTVGLSAIDLSVGGRVGVSASFLFGSYSEELSTWLTEQGAGHVSPQLYPSVQASLFCRLGLSRRFALQADLAFGPVGGALLASKGFDLLIGVSANELSLPLLAILLLDIPVGTLSVFAGPFAAAVIGKPILVQNDGLVRSESGLAPEAISGGLVAGAGFQFSAGPGWVIADLRYTHRFLSLIDTGSAGTALTPLGATLTAGYMVPIISGRAGR
jgi:hypothetical protein